jgi:hypothetical protein
VQVLHGVRNSQPPRPRVMRGLAARLNSKRSQGMPQAGYRAAKRVEFRGADLVQLKRRQHPPAEMAWRRGASRGRRPHACGDVLSSEPGEISLASGPHTGSAHEGNSRTMSMNAGEKSDGCMVPVKPRTMPSDIGGGDGGGTAAGRGEGELRRRSRTQCRIRPVTEAASPRIGAAWVPNTPKADRVRPETGARCGKAARRDLHGGRGAILVPTVTVGPPGEVVTLTAGPASPRQPVVPA